MYFFVFIGWLGGVATIVLLMRLAERFGTDPPTPPCRRCGYYETCTQLAEARNLAGPRK
jgi:hypothetical protein